MFLDLSVISGPVMIGEIEYFQLGRQRYFCILLRREKKKKKERKRKNVIEFLCNYRCSRNFLNEINSELKIVLIFQRSLFPIKIIIINIRLNNNYR